MRALQGFIAATAFPGPSAQSPNPPEARVVWPSSSHERQQACARRTEAEGATDRLRLTDNLEPQLPAVKADKDVDSLSSLPESESDNRLKKARRDDLVVFGVRVFMSPRLGVIQDLASASCDSRFAGRSGRRRRGVPPSTRMNSRPPGGTVAILSPSSRRFRAAFRSRSCRTPQSGHVHCLSPSPSASSTSPHTEHLFELG